MLVGWKPLQLAYELLVELALFAAIVLLALMIYVGLWPAPK